MAGLAFRERMRRAAAREASPWVAALALAFGAIVALAAIHALPASAGDIDAARALGIVSVSTLAKHSKSAESLAYGLGMASALGASVALWLGWARAAGQRAPPGAAPIPFLPRGVSALELVLVASVLGVAFARPWTARAAWISPWVVLSEEGAPLAWVDTVFRGGALSRDVFCLYGPLSIWPVAWLFAAFGPSLGLWRQWIFALNGPALLTTFLLLRGLLRSRSGALGGTLVVGLLCAPAVPALSWSLSRVGLGLGALACLSRALGRGAPRWFVAMGSLLGAALLYSQEVGVACCVAAGLVLLLRTDRVRAILWTSLGGAIVLAPALGYIAARGALAATVDNLFLFPRTRLLGFGALPFPALAPTAESLRAYFTPAVLVVSGFVTATKLLCGERDARTLTELALFVFGALLFSTALSRPDDTHLAFALPPALVLLGGLVESACSALFSPTRRAAAAAGLLIAVAALVPFRSIATVNLGMLIAKAPDRFRALALPRGGGALLPERLARDLEDVSRALQARTAPDEPFWAYPNEALLYFLADRPQPTRFPLVLFAVTRAQRLELVAELERARPRYAVLNLYQPIVDGITYDIAAPEVFAYLGAHYEVDSRFGAFALLRRFDVERLTRDRE